MSSQETSDDTRPAVPPRSSQRDSASNRDSLYHASPQMSPVQPAHSNVAESSSKAPMPPSVPEKHPRPHPQAQNPAQAAPTGAPMQAQQVQQLFPGVAVSDTPKTKRQELKDGDAHWTWKVGFRAISIIVGLIGIGCAAWVTSQINSTGYDNYSSYSYIGFDDAWSIPWTLITFTLAVVWSAACVTVFFCRRSHIPLHPGAQVGCDLILWLAFIVTGTFAIIGTMELGYMSSPNELSYSSYGHYSQATNGTWVWVDTSSSSSSSNYYTSDSRRGCESGSSRFTSCAQQDALVNALWDAKNHRYSLDLAITACQFIACLVHLILFIWACVDTARYNRRGGAKDAEKLAADIVMNMVRNGAIIPAPNQAYFPHMAQQGVPMGTAPMPYPNAQYYPPQQSAWQNQGQWNPANPHATAPMAHGKAPVPQPAAVPSSDEKGAGPRYA